LILTTHEKARKALVKLLKEYSEETEADHTKFKAMVNCFSILLAYFKFEKDIDIEKRIEALENHLSENQTKNPYIDLKKTYEITNNAK
jgi:hypothetical protein